MTVTHTKIFQAHHICKKSAHTTLSSHCNCKNLSHYRALSAGTTNYASGTYQ